MLTCNLKCLYSEALELLCTCSPVHTLISILLIYSFTDTLNVYMYVMYLVFETFHMQELYPTTLHSSELSRGARLCQRGANAPPRPPLNEALIR